MTARGTWPTSTGAVQGDPDRVLVAAQEFGATAASLGQAATNLRRLDSPTTQSDAVTKVLAKSHEMAAQLELVKVRYDEASAALREFEPHLRRAQQEAGAAAQQEAQGRSEANRAADAANQYRDAIIASTDETQRSDYLVECRREVARRDQAEADASRARLRLQQAIDDRNDAANRAADRIENVVKHSPLNDSVVDKFKDVLDNVTEWLEKTKLLEKIADITGKLATAFLVVGAIISILPIPGAAVVGGALLAASRVLAVVALTADLLHGAVIGYRTGDWAGFATTAVTAVIAKAASRYLGPGVGKWLQKGVVKSNTLVRGQIGKLTSGQLSQAAKGPSRSPIGGLTNPSRQLGTPMPGRIPGALKSSWQDLEAATLLKLVMDEKRAVEVTKDVGKEFVDKVTEKAVGPVVERVLESPRTYREVKKLIGVGS